MPCRELQLWGGCHRALNQAKACLRGSKNKRGQRGERKCEGKKAERESPYGEELRPLLSFLTRFRRLLFYAKETVPSLVLSNHFFQHFFCRELEYDQRNIKIHIHEEFSSEIGQFTMKNSQWREIIRLQLTQTFLLLLTTGDLRLVIHMYIHTYIYYVGTGFVI